MQNLGMQELQAQAERDGQNANGVRYLRTGLLRAHHNHIQSRPGVKLKGCRICAKGYVSILENAPAAMAKKEDAVVQGDGADEAAASALSSNSKQGLFSKD